MMRLRSGFTGIVMLMVVAMSLTGCGPTQPEVVEDIESAAAAIVGEGSVRAVHLKGPNEVVGWQVLVYTSEPDAVRDAVLAVFDGRGYAIEQDGSMTTVAGVIIIDPGTPAGDTSALGVWVPTSALGTDGYPTNYPTN